jgi:alkanesulfonate monooxygenase SsuD/methylene tetrahydromethanopterin reductase-like flavin-dependent oxidoreductase (luciferase family)
MKFGVEVIGHHALERAPNENFDDVVEQVRVADAVGLDLVWAGQHYLLEDRQKFQVVPAMSRLAAESDRLYVGANVLFPLHHPVEVAEQFATLDALSDGRAILGPIEGYRKAEFDAFGVDRSERAGRLEEGLEVVKRLWTEDDVHFEGEHFALDGVSANPKPVQDPHPPLWVGANKDPAVRRASEQGTAWLVNPHDEEDVIARQLDMIDPPEGEGWHGLQPAIKDGFVAETDRQALDRFEPYIKEFYDWYEAAGQAEAMETPEAIDLDAAGLGRFAIGSPETVADDLVHLHDDLGIDCVIMYMHRPGIPQAQTLEAMELLGEEVIPRVEERIDA